MKVYIVVAENNENRRTNISGVFAEYDEAKRVSDALNEESTILFHSVEIWEVIE